jgi:hypothetical protein
MAEIVRTRTPEGTSIVVNIDRVIRTRDDGPNSTDCVIHISNSETQHAMQVVALGRLPDF